MQFKSILLFIVTALMLTRCMFTEEIYINNDGSGKYALKIDMSPMMESVKDMSVKDSLKDPQVLDTVVLFSTILEENKDSISKLDADDKMIIESLKDLKLHMQVDEEKGKMIMDFGLDFKDISELKNMQEKIAKAQALNEKKKEDEGMPSTADVDYLFDGKTFERKVTLKDMSEDELEKMGQASSFMEGGIYKVIYHFESKIKNVSFKGAQISSDKKTMSIEVPMDSLIKNPKLLDFEVNLK